MCDGPNMRQLATDADGNCRIVSQPGCIARSRGHNHRRRAGSPQGCPATRERRLALAAGRSTPELANMTARFVMKS
jgi:hypothetical protein